MQFRFTRDTSVSGVDAPPSGFDLGDVVITGPVGAVSSDGRMPSQSFMVYLGIVDLAGGLAGLAGDTHRAYKFVGADSSFVVRFRRNRLGISASADGLTLGSEPVDDVIRGFREGVDHFLGDRANVLSSTELVVADLAASLAGLDQVCGRHGKP